ncbi:hypothetical protein [Klebsiella pneumoniae]|uniref:hypothetical protein n=1 Tax=Klebsiella pneumoniae TaxID=573 RepID=UPI000E2B9814|nr:hypothetical protein [Klebsiella pneumoniae]SXX26334.1 Ead domain protein [Klebsiella pneumoniae]
MTTDITELAQSEINDALAQLKQISEYPTPSTQYARVLRKYIATLVEALEKSEKASEARREAIDITHKRAARERDRANAAEEALEKAQQRIAELESRTVKLPPTFWYEHDDLSRDVPVLDKRLVKKMLREAGIKVEAE